jgi:hypothetical protein
MMVIVVVAYLHNQVDSWSVDDFFAQRPFEVYIQILSLNRRVRWKIDMLNTTKEN